jgi:LPXTG-motif cell wall-anchored protein
MIARSKRTRASSIESLGCAIALYARRVAASGSGPLAAVSVFCYQPLMDSNTLLIIIVIVLLFGGGGFFYRRRR